MPQGFALLGCLLKILLRHSMTETPHQSTTVPLISVLLCAYNSEKFIEEAIESILSQTFRDFELVIVLDAPTDNTRKKVRAFKDSRIRLIENAQNLGLTRSLNVGLKYCRGTWVARQDADDVSFPHRLESQLRYLSQNPQTVLLGSAAKWINRSGKEIGEVKVPSQWEEILWQFHFENPFIHSSIIFKKDLVLGLGGYNENFKRTQDFELWSKIVPFYPVANLKEALVKYRTHENSISSTQAERSNTYGHLVFQTYGKEMGISPENAKALGTIRATRYQSEDIPLLWKALNYLPQLNSDFLKESPHLKSSVYLKQQHAKHLESVAMKSSGVSNALSFCALYQMGRVSWKSWLQFSYLRWLLRMGSGVFGAEAFQKLRSLKYKLAQ